MRDLMPDNGPGDTRRAPRRHGDGDSSTLGASANGENVAVAGVTKPELVFPTAREVVAELELRHGRRTGDWIYTNAKGEPVGLVARWDLTGGKKRILPVSLHDGAWTPKGMKYPRPLYNLSRLASAERVYVTEGEKAADAVIACGLEATTSAHGSDGTGQTDWSPLAKKDVVILPDRDDAGERYAKNVARLARVAGAKSVRTVRLAERWPELPKGGDMADVLELTGGDADVARAGVEALVEATEPEDADTSAAPRRFAPFTLDVLPEPFRSYVDECARAIGCDPSFIALPMLSALAATIGNTHLIVLKGTWTEPAIIWTAIVGESGTAKSPALELALGAVRKRQDLAMKEHAESVKAWEADKARWEVGNSKWKKDATKSGSESSDPPVAPERPVCPRTWVNDITIEALMTRLHENPRGLLMIRDELAGWFDFDRYTSGKGGGEASKWLEVFHGRSLISDRKGGGVEYVPLASVSIAGGIQPETLRRAIGQQHRANGLLARLLFAMPTRQARRWTDNVICKRTEAAMAGVFDALYALEPAIGADGDPEPRRVTLSPEAKRVWVRFVNEHGAEQAGLVGDEAAAWSKLECYAARFALVLHLTRVAANDDTLGDPGIVDEKSIAAGVTLIRWFAGEVERVYAVLSASDEELKLARLVEWIAGRRQPPTMREITRGPREYRQNPENAEADMADLVKSGIGRWETTIGGRTLRFVLFAAGGDTGDCDTFALDGPENPSSVATDASECAVDEWGEV
jgi:hypothetical protein